MELATLTGSEKQIAWATKLRAAMIKDVDQYEAIYATPQYPYRHDRAAAARTFLAGVTEAKWFIEHRGLGGVYILSTLEDDGLIPAIR